MGIHRNLALQDAAEQILVEVVRLVTARKSKLLFKSQLLKSTESVSANISEAMGRGTKANRNRSLTIARGEAEESIQRLRTNHRVKRIEASRLLAPAQPTRRRRSHDHIVDEHMTHGAGNAVWSRS